MKIAIIGSSVAGATAALLLANCADVVVYEKKAKNEVGKKLCANVVTSLFLEYAKKLGLTPGRCVIGKFSKAVFISKNNKTALKTTEIKVDRQRFLHDIVKKAEKKAHFNFNTELTDFEMNGKFVLHLKSGKRKFTDTADILIGADGALSKVAEKIGFKRDYFLCLQTEIPKSKLKIGLEKNSYRVYLGKEFGYYSYIFPYKNKAIIGTGDFPKNAKNKFEKFLKFLKIKNAKINGALISTPKPFKWRKNLFLIGDAGADVKFSGGGIIPAMMAAFGVRDAIVNNDFSKLRDINKRDFVNRLLMKAMMKMNDEEFNYLLEALKDRKFSGIVDKRDKFELKEYSKMLDLRFLRFLPKIF